MSAAAIAVRDTEAPLATDGVDRWQPVSDDHFGDADIILPSRPERRLAGTEI